MDERSSTIIGVIGLRLKGRSFGFPLMAGAIAVVASCSDTAEPQLPPHLEFSAAIVDLGTLREGQVDIRNIGGQAIGPVDLIVGAIQDASGSTVPGATLSADPPEIATLNPGDTRTLGLELSNQGSLTPGRYDAVITARAGVESRAQVAVRFDVEGSDETAAASLKIVAAGSAVRVGDVVAVPVEVRDTNGALLQGLSVSWTLAPANAGFVGATGQFVAYEPGPLTLTAKVGSASDSVVLTAGERGGEGSFSVVGRAREATRYTSDLWLHGQLAYSGTWGTRQVGSSFNSGNTLNVWDVADPATAALISSLSIDARTLNDVKVRADGKLAVVTHEGSEDGLNGITILDLADPRRPKIVGRYTDGLASGVHNVWIEGNYAYLVVDGVGNGLRILDVSDPSEPTLVASYWAGNSFLHDVYVRDGLAFLSHWNAGLVILDVGHGIVGGSPVNPIEVSRIPDLQGQTHNAWYWPEAGYVFVGEEDFNAPGIMRVVDVRNLLDPRVVATYSVPGQPPHNFWLDESTATLHLAWYAKGLRALDVGGDLMGALDRQSREIAVAPYNGGSGECRRPSTFTCTWAPQLHQGLVWVSDMNEGLIALELSR